MKTILNKIQQWKRSEGGDIVVGDAYLKTCRWPEILHKQW
jgi:hypothetical protein